MIFSLAKYLLSLNYWSNASLNSIKKMQLRKFRELFEYARQNSRFYKEFYGKHGVLKLKIERFEDIEKVPLVYKSILRKYSTKDIMTCDMDDRIHVHSTSGSSGEPFKIAVNKCEDYTAHARVFWALKKAGYRKSDTVMVVGRYQAEDQFDIEKDVSAIGMIQRKLNLFNREIVSIYEPVDEIISRLMKTKARVLWSTPSVMQIVCNRLKENGVKLDFPIVFFTSEAVSPQQRELFIEYLGKHLVGLYGAMESPSMGFDFGLVGQYAIFPNSNLFQFIHVKNSENNKKNGNVIITNLINKTMPFIRYDLNDVAEIDEQPGFGHEYIKEIIGRQDDIIQLCNGNYFVHHHAYEMFRGFHECEMYKFVQKKDMSVLLQLKIADNQDKSHVETLAGERWKKRFGDVPLKIEFVKKFEINPHTGKFKNIEIE